MPNYKFLNLTGNEIKSNSGDTAWKVGEWQTHKSNIDICHSGFHCSPTILDALSYVKGEILAIVEVKGKSDKQNDKSVHEQMRITKAYYWQKSDSVALSIYAAELCISNYEKLYPDDNRPRKAIEAAKNYLKNPTEANRSAAESAAESAARSAAWSARSAWSAAESAWLAAWSAAEAAAWSAAESAAWLAAESAGLAAERAAESAARSAAWSARSARSAAIKKVNKQINKWLVSHLKGMKEYK